MSFQNKNHLSLVHSSDVIADRVNIPAPDLKAVGRESVAAPVPIAAEHAAEVAVIHSVGQPSVPAQVIEAGNDFLRQQDIAEGKYE